MTSDHLQSSSAAVPPSAFVRAVVAFSFAFPFRKPLAILRRIWAPILLGSLTLFLLFSFYLAELYEFIHDPQASIGSRILGIALLGLFLLLLFHAVLVSEVAELALGKAVPCRRFLGIRQWAWRLYVANLRLVAVMGGTILFLLFLRHELRVFLPASFTDVAFSALITVLLAWLVAKLWFYLLPICIESTESGVLTKSWRYASGQAGRILAVLFPMFAVALLMQYAGQVLLENLGAISGVRELPMTSLAVMQLQENLLPLIILIEISYLVTTVLTTAARVYAWQFSGGGLENELSGGLLSI